MFFGGTLTSPSSASRAGYFLRDCLEFRSFLASRLLQPPTSFLKASCLQRNEPAGLPRLINDEQQAGVQVHKYQLRVGCAAPQSHNELV